ncbi:UDP-glucuronosyl/UDP-glucosyltransferase [Zymoseptoria tritici IPO323]|uniref:UDP-glucuronosyl/UDP-glucosyltransferase n=1 Tax=Zymoseptoria tritici (strain CBS 115943 / IPO323) TaxID=336722 RepID=F9X6R6_ZYMTI|nr:UDP-glucuronosyl/UDP-glucosyltransferase [Zymoseptoria tritici IPO323]EGP89469.1 UDP-glucuronosyl/UDP-glucosyltransferase [Zymoseptoria tritici IPO323]
MTHHDEDPSMEQHSTSQQARAATAVHTAVQSTNAANHPILLQETDLATPDSTDELAPPAYGNIFGEPGNEGEDPGITGRIADDGRVNIRINQRSRHLSQIFNPALHEQFRKAEDSTLVTQHPPLEDQERIPNPPILNVVIQVVGSRGDVQPFIALGKVLKEKYGHRVRLATHPCFRTFVVENGLEFFSIGGDPSRLMAFMAENPRLVPGFRSIMNGDIKKRRKDVSEYIQGCWRSCFEAGDGMQDDEAATCADNKPPFEPDTRPFVADAIIANPPSFAHIHCAEKLGIPLHIMFTMPYSPTRAFPHPLANIQSSNADPQMTNFISYAMIELLSWQALGDIINRFRRKCLNLDPISSMWGPGMLELLKVPHTYCWSPALIPKPRDWGEHIDIAGFYFLDLAAEYTPSPELQAFLDAGPRPVYIGFGSIVLENPDAMTQLIFETARSTGQRILLSKGWGGIGSDTVPANIFMLDNVPHDWLFQHVSCVVHHGGAGTTAAGIAAGRPTVVIPFFGDQPFWGAMLARAGAGPDPIPHKTLTPAILASAITFCLQPSTLARAADLADKIRAERGAEQGADFFHQHLNVDSLRCALSPSRAAVWEWRPSKQRAKVPKAPKVRLSAFAACTLANAGLLDFRDVKLLRGREWYTDEGPLDPISGGFVAATRAFGGMAVGLAGVPGETWKVLRGGRRREASTGNGRTGSEVSSLLMEEEGKSSSTTAGSAQSQTGASSESHTAGEASSSARSDALSTSFHTTNSRIRNRVEPNPNKHKDRLRPTAPHTSAGAGKFLRTLAQSPTNLSLSLTRGTHNLPKLWNDTTVRPQERVTSLSTGLVAGGREFGYGWYDGLTGLVTHPLKGARQEGLGGFAKGVGKGAAGFVVKPLAGALGVLGYTLKGVSEEVRGLAGGGQLGEWIAAARMGMGYEEWLRSGMEEREGVVKMWEGMRGSGGKEDWKVRVASTDLLPPPATRRSGGEVVAPEQSLYSTEGWTMSGDGVGYSHTRATREASSTPPHAGKSATPPETFARHSSDSSQPGSVLDTSSLNSLTDDPPPAGNLQSFHDVPAHGSSREYPREKTAQDKTEEEIVMEYVRKQSLLEEAHRQGRMVGIQAAASSSRVGGWDEDEDLRRALELSLRR